MLYSCNTSADGPSSSFLLLQMLSQAQLIFFNDTHPYQGFRFTDELTVVKNGNAMAEGLVKVVDLNVFILLATVRNVVLQCGVPIEVTLIVDSVGMDFVFLISNSFEHR